MLDPNCNAIQTLFSRFRQDPRRKEALSGTGGLHRRHPGQDPDDCVTLMSCLKRIRKWRVPPHWSGRDWFEEVSAEATVTALQAKRDFDPGRGVPWGAYLRQRVMNSALARYRREWSYAIHRAKATVLVDRHTAGAAWPLLDDSIGGLLQQALKRLSKSDYCLITELYWEGKSEASLGKCLGISQQAVNKRKRLVLKTLHRLIDDLALKMDGDL